MNIKVFLTLSILISSLAMPALAETGMPNKDDIQPETQNTVPELPATPTEPPKKHLFFDPAADMKRLSNSYVIMTPEKTDETKASEETSEEGNLTALDILEKDSENNQTPDETMDTGDMLDLENLLFIDLLDHSETAENKHPTNN